MIDFTSDPDTAWPGFTVLDFGVGTTEIELECKQCGHVFVIDTNTADNMIYIIGVFVPQCPECNYSMIF